jgi:hypothetical protein
MMFPHPRLFAIVLLLSVYAAAWPPIHSSGRLVNLNVVVLDAAARPLEVSRISRARALSTPLLSNPSLSGACGARDHPTENRLECVRAIAARSVHWRACTNLGNDVACHRYAREVATALARAQPHQGWGWGLISKPRGQRQCTLTECGAEVRGPGYAEDAIAYLPQGEDRKHWIGFDIVGGAGAPGASLNWNGPLPRREDNLWVPLP